MSESLGINGESTGTGHRRFEVFETRIDLYKRLDLSGTIAHCTRDMATLCPLRLLHRAIQFFKLALHLSERVSGYLMRICRRFCDSLTNGALSRCKPTAYVNIRFSFSSCILFYEFCHPLCGDPRFAFL